MNSEQTTGKTMNSKQETGKTMNNKQETGKTMTIEPDMGNVWKKARLCAKIMNASGVAVRPY